MAQTKHDPWARPGFEPWQGPRDAGDFQPMDTKAADLRAFLRSEEVRQAVLKTETEPSVSWVNLPSGATAQLTRKAAGRWELAIPLGRDFFQVISGASRAEVLRLAGIAELDQ